MRASSAMRLGIFLPNWIGDVVMATPAIRALRTLVGPQGRLIGIMRPYVAEVLAGTNWLDESIYYDKPARRVSLASADVYRALRAARLDHECREVVVVDSCVIEFLIVVWLVGDLRRCDAADAAG